MTDIISRWVLVRLGIILNKYPEEFAAITKDGYLLAQMLRSYEIIDDEQLKIIKVSENPDVCNENFNHIVLWLNRISVPTNDEEISDVIAGKGTASFYLFYKVYLELQKGYLDFVTDERLKEKLRHQVTKFYVQEVTESPRVSRRPKENNFNLVLRDNYDIVHWHQDRLEVMINKCKVAREQYSNAIKSKENRLSLLSGERVRLLPEYRDEERQSLRSEKSVHLLYRELVDEQQKTTLRVFIPNMEESKRILKTIKSRHEKDARDIVLKKQFHKDILSACYLKIKSDSKEELDTVLTEKLTKQSLYEKQMVRKLGDVKLQREVMIQNKQVVADAISNAKEKEFIDKLIMHDNEIKGNELQFYMDKQRTLELHRRIYEEKLRLKAERNLRLCSEIVKDLCNLAMKEAEYKEYFSEEPSRAVRDKWWKIFITGENFEDSVTPLENIVKEPESEEDIDEIVQAEIVRQDAIDQKDFESYIAFEWPWELDKIDVTQETLKDIERGMNIISNIVYTLLEAKYCPPVNPPPPELPDIKVAACVNGLIDTSCIPVLEKLLKYKEIIVCEIQDAVNYCIDTYIKEQITDEVDDDNLLDEKRDAQKKRKKEKEVKIKKKGEKKREKLKKKGKESESSLVDHVVKWDKITQTPKIYPFEEITLSPEAELGKIAQEQLAQGFALTDHLLVAMFIAYLKSKKDMKGWVLLNYPTSFDKAALLEQALTGIPVPGLNALSTKSISDFIDIDTISPEVQESADELAKFRTSNLFKKPPTILDKPIYETALTGFIRLIQSNGDKSDTILPELLDDESDSFSIMDQFYSDMGCLYSMYYENFDYFATKHLARLIIGEYSIPPKSSIELFGDTINFINAEMWTSGKTPDPPKTEVSMKKEKEKPKKLAKRSVDESEITVTKEKKTKDGKSKETKSKGEKGKDKRKKDKTSNTEDTGRAVIVREDKWTQIPEEEVEVEPEVEKVGTPKPGDLGWDYLTLRLPEEFEIGLATLWEHVEDSYIEDFKQVFFMKRIMLDNIMPFVVHVKKHMQKCITKPDEKQVYLTKFQQYYNQFDDDMRTDEEFKAELHCRVDEMKERLLDICERRMMEAEDERRVLIRTMWVPRQMIELMNNYVCAYQLELDRCIDTILLLDDFYAGIITHMPCEEPVQKELLPKLDLENFDIQKNVNNLLITLDENKKNPLKKNVEDLMDKCINFVDKNFSTALDSMEKFKLLFTPVPPDPKEKKNKKSKKGEKGVKVFEPEQQVKDNFNKIFGEWETALKGEHARVIIYLKLLQADLLANLDDLLQTAEDTFQGVFEQIKTRYEKETASVMNACNLLAHAIEAETPIQEELLLKADQFCVDYNNILFMKEQPEEAPLSEPIDDHIFTVNQLEYLTLILYDLAPNGFIAERSMVYLLQDLTTKEDNFPIPKSWIKLGDGEIEKLSSALFGEQKYIAWKEFIVCNFMVPYPTVEELLTSRRKYLSADIDLTELVCYEDYQNIDLWFEVGYADQLRVKAVKELLFKLFRAPENKCNYSALLLAFCKGRSNVEGFAKALSLVAGKYVCWDDTAGQIFVDDTLEKRRQHDEEVHLRDLEIEEHTDDVRVILGAVIDEAVHRCESIIIEEITLPDKLPTTKYPKSKEKLSFFARKDKSKSRIKDSDPSRISSLGEPEKEPDKKKDQVVSIKSESLTKHEHDSQIVYSVPSTDYHLNKLLDENREQIVKYESSMIEPAFSNIQIGFEAATVPSMMYFINLDLVQKVLNCIMPEYAEVQNIEDKCPLETIAEYYNELKNPEFNNEVLSHEFLNSSKFKNLLDHSEKFIIKNPVKIVDDLLIKISQKQVVNL